MGFAQSANSSRRVPHKGTLLRLDVYSKVAEFNVKHLHVRLSEAKICALAQITQNLFWCGRTKFFPGFLHLQKICGEYAKTV
jgi:hypothetical protein